MEKSNKRIIKAKSNAKKPERICFRCGKKLLKNVNLSDRPYAIVLKDEHYICDFCIQDLVDIDQENQYDLSERISRKQAKTFGNEKSVFVKDNNGIEELSLSEVISNVQEVVKGQDEHIKIISTAIFKNHKINNSNVKSNILIVGDTGTGKTTIITNLAKQFDRPYVIEDATRFTEAGYHGSSVDDMIKDLYNAAGRNISKAQKGILIIDEGDKKDSSTDGGRNISGKNVLFSLLKIIEGTKVPIIEDSRLIDYFDTSEVTIVFLGAFKEVMEIRDKRIGNKGKIGFNADKNDILKDKNIIPEDFENAGFDRQFIGRFNYIVELNPLKLDDFVDIINNSKNSPLKIYIEEFEKLGVKVIYDDVIDEIAKEAEKLKTGARAISKIVEYMIGNIMYEVLCNENKYMECIITKDTVTDSKNYTLM